MHLSAVIFRLQVLQEQHGDREVEVPRIVAGEQLLGELTDIVCHRYDCGAKIVLHAEELERVDPPPY